MSEIKKLEKGLVEIKGEIAADVLETFREKALKHLGEHLKLDGFRPGHIPMNVVEKNVSDMALMEEMAQMALSAQYGKILAENKIDAIGYPRINITKIGKGSPLGFTIVVATVPDVALPDYKKIASGVASASDVTISDEEFDAAMKSLQKMRAQEEAKLARPDGEGADIPADAPLPELTDEFVTKLGDFKDLADFKTKARANMEADKRRRAADKRRAEIVEALIAATNIDIPDVLVESETAKLIEKMKADIEQMGMSFDDYLKASQKTVEIMKNDLRGDASKRAAMQLIILEIAKKEKIEPSTEEIEAELKKVVELYPDVAPDHARAYIASVLQNEAVMKFLEGQK